MIKINDKNWIIITKDDPAFQPAKNLLTITEKEFVLKSEYDYDLHRYKKVGKSKKVTKYLYNIKRESLYIPYGLYKYVKHLFIDSKTKYCGIKNHPLMKVNGSFINGIDKYKKILSGIELYDNQINAIKSIFINKRGVISAPTGSGKSEIMCATIQIMKKINNNKYPTILVLEPTIELLKGMKDRFKAYKIPINDYRETRVIMTNKVNLAHPKSLVTDLQKNKKMLDKIEVQFIDEAHHSGCKTFSLPSYHMNNLLYSIGLSATFVSHYHINGESIYDFDYDELMRIGNLGPIIYKLQGKDLIQAGQLAKPKLIILHNDADEEMNEKKVDYTWNNVRKIRLQSETRTKLIAEAACKLAKYNRKVIILMNILDWGREILTEVNNLGYGQKSRICYGGQTYEKINKKNGKIEKDYQDALNLFNKDKINILIGSSVLQEGIDLKKVDGIILAMAGKADRTSLQSVGRALRLSKTGKFAYIVDINDLQDRMLHNQFIERMRKYKSVLGIAQKENILNDCTTNQFEKKFIEWEEIKENK